MIRQDGYLNFTQLFYLVWADWRDDLLRFEQTDESAPDYPSAELRRRAFAFWGARTVIDSVEEAALFDGRGGFARLDAWSVFFPKPDVGYEFASDLPIESPVTKASLQLYECQLNSGWAFVDGAIGILRSRRGHWKRFADQEDSQLGRIRKLLVPFHGWTVAVNEKEAKSALKDIGPIVGSGGASSVGLSPLEYTFQCFSSAFPEGKGKATWAEVHRKTGYSRRHIKRALEAFQPKE